MGLGTFLTGWQRQTEEFGHRQGSKFSVLVFDNRGIGKSDKPLARYTTSEMARDALELIDHVGWTEKRQLHVMGVSMGGMIAQELGLLIPERIASMNLVSTAARLVNTIGFAENLRQRINLFIPKQIDVQIADIKQRIFSEEWLAAPDAFGNFPTNGDRFAAGEVMKRQDLEGFTKKGFLLQAIAAGWHKKSPEQLKELGDKVGRNRIQVMHGGIDRMITSPHQDVLVEELGGETGGVTRVFFEKRGHVLPLEERAAFSRSLLALIEKTEAMKRES